MDDDTIKEMVGAAKETAITTGKAIDLTDKVGSFVGRVFGDLVTDAAGIYADKLHYYRQANLLKLEEKHEALLKSRNIDKPMPLPPKYGVPLLQSAAAEDDDSLQDMWAELLTNFRDPNYQNSRHIAFAGLLSQLEPMDARLLTYIRSRGRGERAPDLIAGTAFDISISAHRLGLQPSALSLAFSNLVRLGIMEMEFKKIPSQIIPTSSGNSISFGGGFTIPEMFSPSGGYKLTHMGLLFVMAALPAPEALAQD